MKSRFEKSRESLDSNLGVISKTNRALFPVINPLHEKLNNKMIWYRKWNSMPISQYIHIIVLVLFLLIIGGIFYQTFVSKTSKAAGESGNYDAVVSADGDLSDFAEYPTDAIANNDYDKINDPVGGADGDATYITTSGPRGTSYFHSDGLGTAQPNRHCLSKVTVTMTAQGGGTADTFARIKTGGTEYRSTEGYNFPPSPSWEEKSFVFWMPRTGLPWYQDQLADLQLGVSGGTGLKVTQIYATVDYSCPAGAPSNLVLSATPAPTSMPLSWAAGTGAAGYYIESSITNTSNTTDGRWRRLGSTLGTAYSSTGMCVNSQYSHRVNSYTAQYPGGPSGNCTTGPCGDARYDTSTDPDYHDYSIPILPNIAAVGVRNTFVIATSRGQETICGVDVNGGNCPSVASYPDVPLNYWSFPEIEGGTNFGFWHGYFDGTFKPAIVSGRDYIAAILSRIVTNINVPAGPATQTFADVPPSFKFYDYIEYANTHGYMPGGTEGGCTANNFCPGGGIATPNYDDYESPKAIADLLYSVLKPSYGNILTKYTAANVPTAPTVSLPTIDSIKVKVNQNGNPAGGTCSGDTYGELPRQDDTEYAIQVTTGTTTKWMQTSGGLGDAPSWGTYSSGTSNWGGSNGKVNSGLVCNTTYNYSVKARNGDNLETALGPVIPLATAPCANSLAVAPLSVSLDSASGQTGAFTIASNIAWTVVETSALDWLTESAQGGTNNGTITVTTSSANTSTTARSGTLTFSGPNVPNVVVTVTQQGATVNLAVTPSSVTLGYQSGQTGTFTVTSNTTWTVVETSALDWLTESAQGGTNNGTITVTTSSANTSTTARSGTLTFSGPGVASVVVTIVQNAEALPSTPGIPTLMANSWNPDASLLNSMTVAFGSDSNPEGFEYAISCDSAGTTWLNGADGLCGPLTNDINHWKTRSVWTTGTTNYIKRVLSDTNYQIFVRVRNSVGNTADSPLSNVAMSAPSKPSGLVHTANTTSTITWDFADNAVPPTGYHLINSADFQIEISATSDFVQDQSDPAGTPLGVNTQHTVKARGYRDAQFCTGGTCLGEPSSPASAYTSANPPINGGHDWTKSTTTAIEWTWEKNNNPQGTKFCINDAEHCSADIASYFDDVSSRVPNNYYTVYIYALNGDSEKTIDLNIGAYTAIETPDGIELVFATTNSLDLKAIGSFTNLGSSDGDATHYAALQLQGDLFAAGEIGEQSGFWNATPPDDWLSTQNVLTDSGLVSLRNYTYCARARNAANEPTPCIYGTFLTTGGDQLLISLDWYQRYLINSTSYLLSLDNFAQKTKIIAGEPFNATTNESDLNFFLNRDANQDITLTDSYWTPFVQRVEPLSSGQHTFENLVITQAGIHRLAGQGSSGVSEEFEVVAAACSTQTSTIEAAPLELEIDEISTIRVQLKDEFGNVLAGHAVSANSDQVDDRFAFGGIEMPDGSIVTDENGVIYVYVTSPTAHTSNITVSDTLNPCPLIASAIKFLPSNPPAPVLRVAGITRTTVDLDWTTSEDKDGIKEYVVYDADTDAEIGRTPELNYTVSGLTMDTLYHYYVKAVDNKNLYSAESNTVEARTLGPDNPTAPVLRVSGATETTVSLEWTASTDTDGIEKYIIYDADTDREIGSTTRLTYTDSGLTPATHYRYYIKAVDTAGLLSEPSNVVDALTDGPPPSPPSHDVPTAPVLHVSEVTQTTISLAWTESKDNDGIKEYVLYNADNHFIIARTPDLSYTITGLTCQEIYRFYVKALDNVGLYSDPSNIVDPTTLSCIVPPNPTIYLHLTNTPDSVISGKSFSEPVIVTATDGGGKIYSDYDKAVFFSSSDPDARVPATESSMYKFTTKDAGRHEFSGSDFTLYEEGSQTLKIDDYTASDEVTISVTKPNNIFESLEVLSRPKITNNDTVDKALLLTALLLLLVPLLISLLISLLTFLPQLLYWFLWFFGSRKKKNPWGVVFNSQTGQPINLAMLRIFDATTHRKLEQSMTDNDGRYGFLVKEGTFYIKVIKRGYVFPSIYKNIPFYERLYFGGLIKIANKNQSITLNIPIDSLKKIGILSKIKLQLILAGKWLQKIRIYLLVLGTLFALFMTIFYYELVYLLILIFYLLLWLWEFIQSMKPRTFGKVLDRNNQPIGYAVVRLFKPRDNKLVLTDVTDSVGRYQFLARPGSYYLTVEKSDYKSTKSRIIYLQKKGSAITQDIHLEKN